jgi:hypothetical protein
MGSVDDLVLAHKDEIDDLAQEARDLFRQAVQKLERAQQLYAHVYPKQPCQGAGAIAYTLDVFQQENPARNMSPGKAPKISSKPVASTVLALPTETKTCPRCGTLPILVDRGQELAQQRFQIACAEHPKFPVNAVGETVEQVAGNWNQDERWIQLGADPVAVADRCAPSLAALIEDAETEAARGCGQSDVLYEARVQAAFASILDRAPEAERVETEAALRKRGFDPDFAPYQAGEGECSLTGIDVDCCPCGRHP